MSKYFIQKNGMVVQSLMFDKNKFTETSATAWAKSHGFKVMKFEVGKPGVDVEANTIRVRQRNSGDFDSKSFRTFKLTDGVQAVGGKLKSGMKKNEEIDPLLLVNLIKMFGEGVVREEVKKFMEFGSGPFTSGVDDQWSVSNPQRENKETFDGEKYQNVPPGDIQNVTEDKDDMKKKWSREVSIKKSYDEKKIVIGAVYSPYVDGDESTVDTQGMATSAEEIEKAAYEFMEKYRQIDKQHNFRPGFGNVVESYIAKAGDPLFPEGTWVLGVRVTDDSVWNQIKKGEITGFSLAGSARLKEYN